MPPLYRVTLPLIGPRGDWIESFHRFQPGLFSLRVLLVHFLVSFFFLLFSFNFTDQLIRARCSIFAPPMKLHFFSELERVYTRMSFEFVLFLYLMNDEEFLE